MSIGEGTETGTETGTEVPSSVPVEVLDAIDPAGLAGAEVVDFARECFRIRNWSRAMASRWLDLADDLLCRLPEVHAVMRTGELATPRRGASATGPATCARTTPTTCAPRCCRRRRG